CNLACGQHGPSHGVDRPRASSTSHRATSHAPRRTFSVQPVPALYSASARARPLREADRQRLLSANFCVSALRPSIESVTDQTAGWCRRRVCTPGCERIIPRLSRAFVIRLDAYAPSPTLAACPLRSDCDRVICTAANGRLVPFAT